MTTIVDDLKTDAELLEKAEELVRRAAKETFLPSQAVRLSVGAEVGRIRLQLFGLRRDLTVLRAAANRRTPKSAKASRR